MGTAPQKLQRELNVIPGQLVARDVFVNALDDLCSAADALWLMNERASYPGADDGGTIVTTDHPSQWTEAAWRSANARLVLRFDDGGVVEYTAPIQCLFWHYSPAAANAVGEFRAALHGGRRRWPLAFAPSILLNAVLTTVTLTLLMVATTSENLENQNNTALAQGIGFAAVLAVMALWGLVLRWPWLLRGSAFPIRAGSRRIPVPARHTVVRIAETLLLGVVAGVITWWMLPH